MTWKDKLDIGLKEDAPYRKDNLPASETRGPELPAGPGRSPDIPLTGVSGADAPAEPTGRPARRKPYRVVPVRAASKPKE